MYNLLGLQNVTFRYAFRADHLVLDGQLVCSFLGETISSQSQHLFLYLPVVLRVEASCCTPPPDPDPVVVIKNMQLKFEYNLE